MIKRKQRGVDEEVENMSNEGEKLYARRAKQKAHKPPVLLSNKSSLSHFMDLEERKDLLSGPAVDPLSLSGSDGFEDAQWVPVKQEVPDDVEVCHVTLTDLPLKVEPLPIVPPSVCVPLSPAHVNNEFEVDNDSWGNDSSESEKESIELKDDVFEKIQEEGKQRRSHFCDICNKKLCSKGSVRAHKMNKHKIKIGFRCEVCNEEFEVHREVIAHRNKTHRKEDGKFYCDKCGKKYVDYYHYLTHMRSHDAEDNDQNFACTECSKMFKTTEGLKMHLALFHNSNGRVMREKLKPQEKNFICDMCGKRFSFGCLLRDHINLHTGVKPYVCQVCGRIFAQKASLKQHARTHGSVRPFKCPDCSQGFFSKGDLKKHLRKHTGERPYVCEICGEGFSQSSHLGVHRRSHTGERPFKCDLCGRGFTKRGDVVRHRRIHTGELPYLCQVCGKAFRQSAQCANHIKNHHPDAQVSVAKNPTPVQQWTFT